MHGDRNGDGLGRRGEGEAGSCDLDGVAGALDLWRGGDRTGCSTAGECDKSKGEGSKPRQPKRDGIAPFATKAREKSADCGDL